MVSYQVRHATHQRTVRSARRDPVSTCSARVLLQLECSHVGRGWNLGPPRVCFGRRMMSCAHVCPSVMAFSRTGDKEDVKLSCDTPGHLSFCTSKTYIFILSVGIKLNVGIKGSNFFWRGEGGARDKEYAQFQDKLYMRHTVLNFTGSGGFFFFIFILMVRIMTRIMTKTDNFHTCPFC